tara:strand:+ start:93894 stop:94433 length:540 start_codon:yes stop_codon:yes gene_type:complete
LKKIKLFLQLILVLFIFVVAFQLGKNTKPISSIETKYSTKQDSAFEPIAEEMDSSDLKKIYVPVYSHIYVSKGDILEMAVTLSIRNTDRKNKIKIERVDYFSTNGKKLRSYFAKGLELSALESKEVFIKDFDTEGGSGANFIVYLSYDEGTNPTLVESIMSSRSTTNSFVFSSRGEYIK